MKKIFFIFISFVLLVPSCVGQLSINSSVESQRNTEPSQQSPSATISPSKTSIPTNTPTITATATSTQTLIPPTITPTPWELSSFNYPGLYPGISPVQYLEDPCTYLENRWGEDKSQPGTIVVPIMFHSIAKPGREIVDTTTISMAYFEYFMNFAKEMGFSTITVNELIGFLTHNEYIPERSMVLILDDRRPGVTELFMPYLEANDWTLTLAWPTTDGTDDTLWARMEGLAQSGRLDVQSHGHDHIYIQDFTPLEEIEEEIFKPIEVIQDHFDTLPEAIIWPGGNFTQTAVELAREAGFELGFTVYSRGPLMFNWIPQGDPERVMEDPLMVLPRYWSTAADVALLDALEISESAKEAALLIKSDELKYYELYCQPVEND
jgi:peptidoglycan/xylan/chitin deacetylase (PgdA/CDA1 family)